LNCLRHRYDAELHGIFKMTSLSAIWFNSDININPGGS